MPSHKAESLIIPTLLGINTQSFGGIGGPTNSLLMFAPSLPDDSHTNKCVQTRFCAHRWCLSVTHKQG